MCIDRYILPYFNEERLVQDITSLDVEEFFLDLGKRKKFIGCSREQEIDSGLSGSSLAQTYTVMNQAFKKAVQWQYISENPVLCDRPTVKNEKLEIWSPDMMADSLSAMRADGLNMLELAISISFSASARKGEVQGLTFDCVDEDTGYVLIEKQMLRLTHESIEKSQIKPLQVFPSKKESNSSLALMPTKTDGSYRKVKIDPITLNMIKKRKADYDRSKEFHGDKFHDYGFIISHDNGMPIDPRRLNSWLNKFLADHTELPPIVFHGVRHSSASYKINLSGGDYLATANHLGHDTIKQLIDRYGHVLPEEAEKLSDRFNEDFSKKRMKSDGTQQLVTDKASSIMDEVVEFLGRTPDLLHYIVEIARSMPGSMSGNT